MAPSFGAHVAMKLSIIIPTHNRHKFLAAAVKHATNQEYSNYELIVSDNSTNDHERALNKLVIEPFLGRNNIKLIYPPRILSPPEHFESTLAAADGDYFIYLTDKMILLPHTLKQLVKCIKETKADVVNWGYAQYIINDVANPEGRGTILEHREFAENTGYQMYDSRLALDFKASGATPRHQQTAGEYVLGKIVFGCYHRNLIKLIQQQSGTVFCGATHDYSAMVQALSISKLSVTFNNSGIIFLTAPRSHSIGALTASDSMAALRYYQGFSYAQQVMADLLVPNVYASQHNMVAHDYKKFLPIYGRTSYFNAENWLCAIYQDLISPDKVWINAEERASQLERFFDYLRNSAYAEGVNAKLSAFEQIKNKASELSRREMPDGAFAHLRRRLVSCCKAVIRRASPTPASNVSENIVDAPLVYHSLDQAIDRVCDLRTTEK